MLRLKKIKSLFILVFALAFAVSCSNDDEVIEQQEPQTQISDELKQTLITNSGNTQESQEFLNTVNWYSALSSTSSYCGVEIAVLAYELFDATNNSLNEINIVPWISGQGLTFEDLANQLEQIAVQEYGDGVQVIFVAGILVKPIDDNSYEVAEISNYATFSDFFDDCQSDDVIFEINEGTFNFDFPMPNPDSVDFPDSLAPCASLDFPLDIVVAEQANLSVTFEETVDQLEFLDYLQGEVTGFIFIDFVYPVSLTLANGTQVFVGDATELNQIINQDCN